VTTLELPDRESARRMFRQHGLTVLDGMHRLLQAHLKGHRTVLVKALPFGRLEDIACFCLPPG
jgi:hypothetical protein